MVSKHTLQLKGIAIVSLSAILYGWLGFLGTKLIMAGLSISAMLFWRFFLAGFWVLVCRWFFSPSQKKSKPFKITPAILLYVITYSGAGAFYFMASPYIGTGIAMVIFFSYSIFVFLFAWLFSSWRFNPTALISLLLLVLGLFCLKGEGNHVLNLTGIFYAVLAALSYAIYVYANQHTAKRVDSQQQTLAVCFGNALIFGVVAAMQHTLALPPTLATWGYALMLAIFTTALPIQLLLDGLKYLSPIKASVLSVLEPVITVVVGIFLLHEVISGVQVIGIIIVLTSAVLIQFEKSPV